MRIIQFSDSHISRDHPARAAELKKCVQYVNALNPQPDVVIHTGDVSHDGHPEEYDTARQIMDELSVPYFVLAGNRDKRQELIKVFADGKYIQNNMGFLQYSVERFDARLIIVDTVSDKSNKGRLCDRRLVHLRHMLSQDPTKAAVLFLHHPPFEVNTAPDPFQYEDWAEVKAFETEIAKHPQIRAILCGHVHQNFESAIGAVPASTISCIASDLRKGKSKLENLDQPIFRLHTITSNAEAVKETI